MCQVMLQLSDSHQLDSMDWMGIRVILSLERREKERMRTERETCVIVSAKYAFCLSSQKSCLCFISFKNVKTKEAENHQLHLRKLPRLVAVMNNLSC